MERRRVTVLSDAATIRARAVLPPMAGCKMTVEEKNMLMCNFSNLVYPITLN